MVRGDQRVAKECYSASMKQKTVDNIYLDELDMRDEVLTQPEPSEELEPVLLDDDPEHLAYIGSKLTKDLKSPFTHLLRQNKDVFAWKQADMGGIDPTIISNRLNMTGPNPDTPLGFLGWSRLVKSHCTNHRECTMGPHLIKK